MLFQVTDVAGSYELATSIIPYLTANCITLKTEIMRTLLMLVLLCPCLFTLTTEAQNIWIVSNDPGFLTADFDTIQNAIDSAAAGDKIYVHGSVTPYFSFTLDKKLHIIGPGFWKTENDIPDENPFSAEVLDTVKILTGADSCIIEGMYLLGPLNIAADHVIVRYNRITQAVDFIDTPIGCFLYSNVLHRGLLNAAVDALIFNSLFYSNFESEVHWSNNTNNSNCLVQNNVMIGTNPFSVYQSISNCTIRNNIFANVATILTNCTTQHNIFVDAAVTGAEGNGNILGVDPSMVWNLSDPSPDGIFRLIGDAGSNPAIEAGINGEDCGMFGGETPYRISGVVKVPTIYQMLIPLTGDTTNMLNVTIKAKSNN